MSPQATGLLLYATGVSRPSGIITLLTDFGLSDPFVGVMKGVILTRFPTARFVDLTHGVPAQDVVAAAFWLERSYPWFPVGTVHLAVVDPGVGSRRAQVAVGAHGHYFVAPDNGLLANIARSDPNARVRAVDPSDLNLPEPSATFYGRDLFAPIAADLASGRIRFEALGRPSSLEVVPEREPDDESSSEVRAKVIVVDHFGNLITNVEAPQAARLAPAEVLIGAEVVAVLARGGSYASVAKGQLVALVNAQGALEVAEREGNAAARLGVGPGAELRIRRREPDPR